MNVDQQTRKLSRFKKGVVLSIYIYLFKLRHSKKPCAMLILNKQIDFELKINSFIV